MFRIYASLAPGSQFTAITHVGTAGNSAPHADSRDIDFDANGDMTEGGVSGLLDLGYRPAVVWQKIIG